MSERQNALNAITTGDLIFGTNASGRGLLLLVDEADEDRTVAHHVPSMGRAEFGRDGRSRWCDGGGSCWLVSTAALPAEDRAVAIGLDRKRKRAMTGGDQRLSEPEIRLLLTVDAFFKARLLPDA